MQIIFENPHSIDIVFCGKQVTFWGTLTAMEPPSQYERISCGMQVIFEHPNYLPGPQVPGLPPFAADFLLDTVRAATLYVCTPAHLPASCASSMLPMKPVRHRVGPFGLKPRPM